MTWHLTLILPAALCVIGGYVCGNNARVDFDMGDSAGAVKNGIACAVCWTAAGVALMGALLS